MEQLVSSPLPRGSFGALLRARRCRALLSQEQLGVRAGVSVLLGAGLVRGRANRRDASPSMIGLSPMTNERGPRGLVAEDALPGTGANDSSAPRQVEPTGPQLPVESRNAISATPGATNAPRDGVLAAFLAAALSGTSRGPSHRA